MNIRGAPTGFGWGQEGSRSFAQIKKKKEDVAVNIDIDNATTTMYYDLDLGFCIYHIIADKESGEREKFMLGNKEISKEECMDLLRQSEKYVGIEL